MEIVRTDSPSGRRLDSWKEIATYLGRHERTVIRWEKKKRLPVHRVPGGERQAVFAYTAELDAWLTREGPHTGGPKPPNEEAYGTFRPRSQQVGLFPRAIFAITSGNPRPMNIAAMVAAVVILSVFALFGWRSRAAGSRFPARVGFTLNAVQVFDDKNQLLWAHTFPGTLAESRLSDGKTLTDISRIADFRGKGDREVLVVVLFNTGPNAGDSVEMEADCFSSGGQLLWSYVPKEKFKFGQHDIQGPWNPTDVFVSSHGGRSQIWLALDHQMWGNSFVVNLDPSTGMDTLRFVNTGAIHTLNELVTPHGNFLLGPVHTIATPR